MNTEYKYHLNVYVQKETDELVRQKAKKLGVSVSGVCNMLILRGLNAGSGKI